MVSAMAAGSWICLYYILLLLFLLPTKTTAQDQTDNTGSCAVKFLTQPPKDLPCNPYDPSFNRLRIQCDVAIPRSRSDLRVRWYRLQLGNDEPENVLDRANPTFVYRRGSRFDNQILITSWLHMRNITVEDIGTYWCQVDDEDEPAAHKPCTVTHLGEPSQYSALTVCPRTYFFSLGPVCVHPYSDCLNGWSVTEMQPNPSPAPTSSMHNSTPGIDRESITSSPITTQVGSAVLSDDTFFWYILVIAGVTLTAFLTLGLIMLVSIAIVKKRRSRRTRVTPDLSSVHIQTLQRHSVPYSPNRNKSPLHLSVTKQLSHDSNYATPEQLRWPKIHSQQCQSDPTWSDLQTNPIYGSIDSEASLGRQETEEARRHLQTVERDGRAYLVISRSPTSPSDEVLEYTVPSMVMQNVSIGTSTNTDSVAMESVNEIEVSYHAYENEPPPRYAPLQSETLDQPRTYSLPMSKKCRIPKHLPATTSTD